MQGAAAAPKTDAPSKRYKFCISGRTMAQLVSFDKARVNDHRITFYEGMFKRVSDSEGGGAGENESICLEIIVPAVAAARMRLGERLRLRAG